MYGYFVTSLSAYYSCADTIKVQLYDCSHTTYRIGGGLSDWLPLILRMVVWPFDCSQTFLKICHFIQEYICDDCCDSIIIINIIIIIIYFPFMIILIFGEF